MLLTAVLCYYVYMAKWKTIKAKVPDVSKFVGLVEPGIVNAMKGPQQDFMLFTSTWDHKPTIRLQSAKTSKSVEVFTGVISSWSSGKKVSGADRMFFVARGTKVRWVKMTHDFIPKTKVGQIPAGPGRGGVYGASLKPLPGIKKRNTEKVVKNKREREIVLKIKAAVRLAVVGSGGTML